MLEILVINFYETLNELNIKELQVLSDLRLKPST